MNNQGIFRKEAIAYRADRLHGTVSIAMPLSWQIIGLLLLGSLALVIIFLATASYARTETVSGVVALDTGIAAIMPSRSGVIEQLYAREGQAVRKGQTLVAIRAEEDMMSGDTVPDRIDRALLQQDARLAARADLLRSAASSDQARLAASIIGIDNEIESLDRQITDQRRLVEVAAREFADVEQVAKKGFISRRDVEAREANMLLRRQQLAQLEQQLAAQRANLIETAKSANQAAATADAQIATNQSDRAAVSQRRAEADLSRGYRITAPVAGVVAGMTSRIGQSVKPDEQLMIIVPNDAHARAELYLPTAAAGFVAPGQEARLAVDAFPYQRFGTVTVRIVSISAAVVRRTGADDATPAYLVVARLDQPWIMAFGRRQRLVPGMKLSARIVTERRTLIEWLFEPLFAVRDR